MKAQEETKQGLFKPAQNQMAYLKAGILGFPGSGKTYTSAMIAKGIVERLNEKRPVFFADSETGSDFLVPKFKEWGIQLYVSKSRAFTDLLDGVKMAEEDASVLIIDSISHYWTEVQDAYKKAHNRNRLLFQDWMPIKAQWARFTDLYLNSRVHIIMCGRAGYQYDYFTDEDGVKQLEKTGTKMKAESDMGYEPSLLIEMSRESKAQEHGKKKVVGQLWDHVAYVLKDRTTKIEGARFVNPTFDCFRPVFDFLNIGGTHIGVITEKNSTELFDKNSDKNFLENQKRVKIMMEEIQGLLVSAFPGRSTEEVKLKTDIIFNAFGTRSWSALEERTPEELRRGFELIKNKISKIDNGSKVIETKNKMGVKS